MSVVVPDCAARCSLVTELMSELARAKGTSEDVQRVTHGIPGEARRPMFVCTECGHPYSSRIAARECADFDLAEGA